MSSEVISLSDERRPIPIRPDVEPERSTPYVGMIIFLAAWAILFAALFAMFGVYRVRQSVWPPEGLALPIGWPAFNTLVIALSSASLFFGARSLRAGRPRPFAKALIAATVLAALFLGLQLRFWVELWSSGIQIRSGLYASFFYLLTVFHGLHAAVGLVLLGWLIPQAFQSATPRRAVRVKIVSMFWHFVGVIWLLTFVLLFLT